MRKKIYIIYTVFIFFSSSIAVYAEDLLPLEALIQEARKNNPEILAALKRYEAAKARIPQAKSLEDPVIGLKFEKAKGSPLNLDTTPAMDRMLSISQMLPWFGKLPLKGKIAVVESQMFAGEYKNKELEIINKVKNAYYDLFMNHKEIELKEESLRFLEIIAKVAEAKYVVGEIAQEDIFKINLEIAKFDTDIINLTQEKRAKETYFNSILHREPESPLSTPYLLEEDIAPLRLDIASLYKATLQSQPELLIFSYAIEKNKYAKSLAKKSFFPDLMAGIAMRGLSTGSIGPWDLMLSFTAPLWFWTKQRYEVKEAIANLEEAQAVYQSMKNKALAETKGLATKVEIAGNKIKLYKNSQIPLLESAIESSLSSYRAGKGDIMMLLDNERMLVATKMDYYKALVEYYMNLADLEKNVGRDLGEVKNEE
ncbi:MAG: TolC family protein [Candidatus Omnitrophica bacterium]|nr:TolC family protein [Candidatus Omnitrophota bacterium]